MGPTMRAVAAVASLPDDCVLWTGCVGTRGYGLAGNGAGGNTTAHCVVYELAIGPIPAGLTLDHLCRQPLCVNPRHLEPVTNRVNTMRARALRQEHDPETHCKHGHERTPENTRVRPCGKRECRACVRAENTRRRATRKAPAPVALAHTA